MRSICLPLGLVVLLVAPASGCDDEEARPFLDVPPRDHSPVQTDRLDYVLHPELTQTETGIKAIATYTNDSGSVVLYQRCNSGSQLPMFDVDRAAPDSGDHVLGPAWACVGGVEAGVIDPGQSVELEVPLGSSSEGGSPPITMEQRTGLFRVTLRLFESFNADSEQGVRLPLEQRQSNVFAVRPPEQ